MLESIRYDQRYDSLIEVYQCKSYTLAAQHLALTPSAVSQQIHSVERELNITLFIRRKNRLVPTSECETVVSSVRKIQALCRKLSDGIGHAQRHLERLYIGVTPSAENYALTGMLMSGELASSLPQIKITSGSAEELCHQLRSYEIDLAIIEGQCDASDFASVILDTDHLTVAVPPSSPLIESGILTIRQLLAEKLILKPQKSGTRLLLEAGLKSIGIPTDRLNVIMEIDSIDTIIRLVNGGYGLSVLSNNACREYVARGDIAVVSLEGLSMCRTVRLLYRPNDGMQEIVRTIHDYYNRPPLAGTSKEENSKK